MIIGMSNNELQRVWEKHELLQEQRNDHVVHCLIDVVAIERSIRQMTYSVTEDFLRVFGPTGSTVHAGTTWKSRKHVDVFLRSVVKGGGSSIFDDSIIKTISYLQVHTTIMTRFAGSKSLAQQEAPGSSTQQDSGIVWSGKGWVCSKQLKHYSSFVINRRIIPVHSFVWIKGEEQKHYLSYLVDMYEDRQGEKMVRARLFANSDKIEGRIPNLRPESREVFMTPLEQKINVECIDGVAPVLTPAHFKECHDLLPQTLSSKTFVCYRGCNDNEVKPFSLSTLRGYDTQPILNTLKSQVNRRRTNRVNSTEQVHGSVPSTALAISENQETKGEPSRQRIANIGAPAEQPQSQWLPKVGENIELLSQDSGMRGCWLRCKILALSHNRLRVQYYDVDDVDGPGKLEEWVPASRVATPDASGVRCDGRLTVRPWPDWDSTARRYELGAPADAWCEDGWWEGLVIGCNPSGGSTFHLYFPDENKFLPVDRKNMRVSKDWVENKWVSLEPKSDILAFLTQSFHRVMGPPLPVVAGQANNSVPATNGEEPSSSIRGEGNLPSSSNAANQNGVDELNVRTLLIPGDNAETSQRSSGNAGKDDSKGKRAL